MEENTLCNWQKTPPPPPASKIWWPVPKVPFTLFQNGFRSGTKWISYRVYMQDNLARKDKYLLPFSMLPSLLKRIYTDMSVVSRLLYSGTKGRPESVFRSGMKTSINSFRRKMPSKLLEMILQKNYLYLFFLVWRDLFTNLSKRFMESLFAYYGYFGLQNSVLIPTLLRLQNCQRMLQFCYTQNCFIFKDC